MNLVARDCSPLEPQPSRDEAGWLRQLQVAARPASHVVGIGNDRDEDEPVVHCERDGTWWAGRYVGSLSFAGGRLTIVPRFGINTLRSWLFQVTNIALVESPGELREDEAFMRELIRKDRERHAAQERLEELLLDGLASGPASEWTEEDWASIRERVTKRLEAKKSTR